MFPRRGAVIAAVLASLAFAVSFSRAAERVLEPLPADVPRHAVGPPGPDGACILGNQGEATNATTLYPPDDTYFTLLRPSVCGPCSVVVLAAAKIQLEFRVPCTVPVELRLVSTIGDVCPGPNRFDVLQGPIAQDLTAVEEGITEFSIALPPEWRTEVPVFLAVSFVEEDPVCVGDKEKPRLAVATGCTRCRNYYLSGETFEDACPLGGSSPLIAVEVGECIPTPVLRRSWGSIKLHYR